MTPKGFYEVPVMDILHDVNCELYHSLIVQNCLFLDFQFKNPSYVFRNC